MAFYNIEPFGEERDDLRAGMIASPLINLWSKKGSKRVKPSDFIMRFDPKEPQTPETMKALLKGYCEMVQRAKHHKANSAPPNPTIRKPPRSKK